MEQGYPDHNEIRSAIGTVYDPCSVNAGAPITVLDMGLILGWESDAQGNILIRMRLTSPGCTLAPSFMQKIELAVSQVANVANAKVRVTGKSLWSELDIAPESLQRLRNIRQESLKRLGTKPQQWRDIAVSGSSASPVAPS